MATLPFQTGSNFCNVPAFSREPIAILGAPFDSGTSYRSGARMAPAAIRRISQALTDGTHELFPMDLAQWVGDAGNAGMATGNTERAINELQSAHHQLLSQGAHVITLGGDHTITLATLASINQTRGPVGVLHFDAHPDTWSSHFGEPVGHGTWLRTAIEQGLVDPAKVVSVGVRSPCDRHTREWLGQQGGTTISARSAMGYMPQTMSDVLKSSLAGSTPIYLSLDIDCLDPAYAPGTGTPETGGLTTMWLGETLDKLFYQSWGLIQWAGMDLVEVAPAYDHSEITSLAAATFVWQYASMMAAHFKLNPTQKS